MQKSEIQCLYESVNNFIELNKLFLKEQEDIKYHVTISSIHDLVLNLLKCEKAGFAKEQLLEIIEPVRFIHGKSVLIKRLQEWPRGYCGDFETIEYLCNAKNQSPQNTVEYYLENYALKSAIVQQHRNKINHQAQVILETILNNSTNTKVLSIASGSNRDVHSIAKYIENKSVQFVLNDMDSDAIEFSKKRLQKLDNICHYVHGNVIRKVKQFEQMGKYDLVVIGGLFDYMKDRHIIFLLKNIYEKLLKSNGKIYFTNIAEDNPYRVWMEYLVDWVLIERSQEDILRMIERIGKISEKEVKISKDETELTWLVEISRV